jgi:hypothetical protein
MNEKGQISLVRDRILRQELQAAQYCQMRHGSPHGAIRLSGEASQMEQSALALSVPPKPGHTECPLRTCWIGNHIMFMPSKLATLMLVTKKPPLCFVCVQDC